MYYTKVHITLFNKDFICIIPLLLYTVMAKTTARKYSPRIL